MLNIRMEIERIDTNDEVSCQLSLHLSSSRHQLLNRNRKYICAMLASSRKLFTFERERGITHTHVLI
jgi:hypothetical protein